MPEMGDFYYLLEFLFEIGPLGSDRNQITSAELIAWQTGTGLELTSWEFSSILDLSRIIAGCVRTYNGANLNCPNSENKDKDVIGKGVAEILGKFGNGRS